MDATQVLWTGDAPSEKDGEDEQPYAELLVYKNDSDMTDVIKHPLHQGENKIGRGDEADVKIDSVSLSRIHAIITINPEVQEYGIEDEKSTNGTRLGEGKGKRLKPNKEYELKHGQFVTFGEIKCRFEVLPIKEKETEAAEARTPVIDADATQAYFPDDEETKPSPQTSAVSRPVVPAAAPAASFDATQLYVDDVPVSSVNLPSTPQTGATAPTFEPTQLYVEEPVGGGSPLYHNSNHEAKHDTNATQLYIEDTPKKVEEEETGGHAQGQDVKATTATCEPTQMYMEPSPVLITATCEPTQEYVPPPPSVGQPLPVGSTVIRAPTCEPTQEYISPVGASAGAVSTPPTRHTHAGSEDDSDATVAESEDEETTHKSRVRVPTLPAGTSNRESIASIATEDDEEDWLFKAKPPVRPSNVARTSMARSSSTSREPVQDDLLSLYEESERPKPLQPAVTDEVKTVHVDASPSIIEPEPKFSTPVKEREPEVHGSPFEIRADETRMDRTPGSAKTQVTDNTTPVSEEEKKPVRGSTRAKKRTQKVIEEEEEEEAEQEEQKPAKTAKKRAKKGDDEEAEKVQVEVTTTTPVQPTKEEKKRKRGVEVSASKENHSEEDRVIEGHSEAIAAIVKPAAKSKKKPGAIIKTPVAKGSLRSQHAENEQTPPVKPSPEKPEKQDETQEREDKMEVDEPHTGKAIGKGKRTAATAAKDKGKGKGKQAAKEKSKKENEKGKEKEKEMEPKAVKEKEEEVVTPARKKLPARAKRGKNARLQSDEEDEAAVVVANEETAPIEREGGEEEQEEKGDVSVSKTAAEKKKKNSTPPQKKTAKKGSAVAAKTNSVKPDSKKRKLNEKSTETDTETKEETPERKSQKKEEEEEGEQGTEEAEEQAAAPHKKRRTSQGAPSSSPHKKADTHTPGPSKGTAAAAAAEAPLKLLFTGVVPDGWAKEMKSIGATVCENVKEPFTHVVTDKVKRTVKFLSAVGKGSHIVTTKWLDESYKAKQVLDEKKFAVKDPAVEKQFGFSLARSLQKANEQPLLAGKRVYITPNVVPKPQDFAEIIECSGGKLRASPPSSFDENTLVMSVAGDKKAWPSLVSLGYTVYSNELLLTGVLKQELELEKNILASPASSSSSIESGSKSTGKRRRS